MRQSGPHLVFEAVTRLRLLVSCQTDVSPSDEEWDAWIQAHNALWGAVGEFRLLVLTDGGHPSEAQVERLRRNKKHDAHTAIVTKSVKMHFVASSMSFLNPRIRCFEPSEFDRAWEYLELTAPQRIVARSVLERLQETIARARHPKPP